MNLPDFLNHVGLNRLRREMGADLIPWNAGGNWKSIDIDEILTTTGIEIPPENIEYARDGTLEYEGRKVIVYIRDQIASTSAYRFHVADCRTLQAMRSARRYERYVVATRTDGKFIVNLYSGNSLIKKDVECELHICKNCLTRLNYKNYKYRTYNRDKIWNSFDVKEFFNIYGSQITKGPTYTDITAPLNEYPPDWNSISRRYKERVKWICEECGVDLNREGTKKFLHVHHRNGQKYNNGENNLCALCIRCHAEMPQHQHMKSSRDYILYESMRRLSF